MHGIWSHTLCARVYPPNATRRPSVLMMVCAVRLGTLTDGHAKNALHRTSWCRASLRMTTHHRHTHTHIHTYIQQKHTHTSTYTTTHAHTNYSHSHISLRHNSHHTYVHDHTGIIHTYTNTYMHSHTRIPPPLNLQFTSSSPFTLALLLFFHCLLGEVDMWGYPVL